MMTQSTHIMIPGLFLVLTATAVHAQPDADADRDGRISYSEFITSAEKRFEMYDIDKDGYLSSSERDQARATRAHQISMARFQKADTNDDGVISEDEFTAIAKKRQRAIKQGKRSKKHAMSPAERAKGVDTNGDGRISRQEYLAQAEKKFTLRDTNKDGFLVKGEGRL